MKIVIKILYNGKSYNSLDDAFLAATMNGMAKIAEKKLEPFADEIAREGGEVIYDIQGDSITTLKGEVRLKHVSPELTKRITDSLRPK